MSPQRYRGVATLLFLAMAASATAAPDRLAALIACRDLTEAAARLACFDRESAALAHAAEAAALTPDQTFGLPPMDVAAIDAAATRRTELTESEAQLAGLAFLSDGRIEFTLDNGQVWRQLSRGEELLLKSGDTVKLSRGALHSYWLNTPSGRRCKVRRVR